MPDFNSLSDLLDMSDNLIAAIGPPIAETGQRHPIFGLAVVTLIVLIGGILGYFGLKKRLNRTHFRPKNK